MNIIWIIFFVLVIVFVFSGTGGVWYSKSRTRISGRSRPNDAFENNKRIWQHNVQKTITVPYFNYQENYNDFPFFSNYQETREFLLKQKVSSKQVDHLLRVMNSYESQILRFWSEEQKKLLRVFDQTMLGTSPQVVKFLLGFYNLFLDAFRQEVITFLINKILVAELGRALGKNPREVIQNADYEAYIQKALGDFYTNFSNDTDRVIKRLFDELTFQFNNFYRQQQESFNNQQHQQNTFQENFDEVAQAYTTLGVEANVSDDELKSAYRKLAMKYHPDRNPSKEAKEKMAKINAAYDLVKKIRDMK